MPLPPSDFEQLFAAGARHTVAGEVVTIRLRQDASLWLPSGRVVAGEPFMFDASGDSGGFLQRVPPGRYPLVLVLAVFGSDPDDPDAHSIIAAAKLVIRDEPVASWEMAVYEGQDVSTLGDDEFFGYPVDGGTGGFVDAHNIAALCADHDAYLDKVMAVIGEREDDYVAPGVLTDDAGEPVAVMFSSGGGDGHYPTWIGRTADGEVACVLTDFFILPDEDEDEDEEAVPPEDYALTDFAQGHEMRVGQTLRRQSLTSPSGRYVFVHQDDGNLVLYDTTQPYARWASGTEGDRALLCALRANDGLVLLDDDGRAVWASGVRRPAARLVVRDDGAVAIEDTTGTEVWSSGTAEIEAPTGPAATGDRMLPGQTLSRQSLTSPSGRRTLVHQQDGNLVLYDNEQGGAVWSSGTDGDGTVRCVLHPDGDLTLYDGQARAVWSTATGGHRGSVLTVGDESVELRTPDGTVLWQAGGPHPLSPGVPFSQAHPTALGQPLSAAQPLRAGTPLIPAQPLTPARPMSALEPLIPAQPTAPSTAARSAASPAQPMVPGAAAESAASPAQPMVPGAAAESAATPAQPAVPGAVAESAASLAQAAVPGAVAESAATPAQPAVPGSSPGSAVDERREASPDGS